MTDTSLSKLQHEFCLKPTQADGLRIITNDSSNVFEAIEKGQQFVTIAAMDHEELNNKEKVAAMDANFKELMDLENRVRNQTLTLNALSDRIKAGEKIKDIMVPYKQVQKLFEDKWNDNDKRYNVSDKYSTFRQNIWNIHHPDEIMPSLDENEDDDIVMGSTKISLRCPLTTAWLEDPVTSNICKHTFSRAAIINLLRQSGGSVPCPIPGCNKQIVNLCLIADDTMVERVRRARERDELNASTTQFFDVD
ncbi:hypothetical protein MFLAVUS_008252 [Mucor flavus]|uniref:SP-RING-type domain-containing protein n=1 Tax=Mucor flavus TaxID=439312 RepID=A0ABP9Z6J4_9FUNG